MRLKQEIFLIVCVSSALLSLSSKSVWADYFSRNAYPYYGSSPRSAPIISLELDPQASLDSAMRIAAREDRLDDVIRFLEKGARVNSSSETGETALMYASRNCSEEIVLELIHAHASVNARDDKGRTALMYASADECVPVVKALLHKRSIEIELTDRSGKSALDYAIRAGSLEVGGPAYEIERLLLESRDQLSDQKAHD